MQSGAKYRKISPPKVTETSVEEIRERLRNFNPEKVIDNYLSQDPKHSRNLNPKAIYEIEDHVESQAERIIKKFGGVGPLLKALQKIGKPKTRSTVYRWVYPREKGGTGGVIPTSVWPDIFIAARFEGVFLSPEEVDARSEHIRRFTTVASTVNGNLVPFINSIDDRKLELHQATLKSRALTRRKRTLKRRAKQREELLAKRELEKKLKKLQREKDQVEKRARELELQLKLTVEGKS